MRTLLGRGLRRTAAIAVALGAAVVSSIVQAAPAQAGDTYYPNAVSSTVTPGMTAYTQRMRVTTPLCPGDARATTIVEDWSVSWSIGDIGSSGMTVRHLVVVSNYVSGYRDSMTVGKNARLQGGPPGVYGFGPLNIPTFGSNRFEKILDVSPDTFRSNTTQLILPEIIYYSNAPAGACTASAALTFELVPQGATSWYTGGPRQIKNIANGQCLLVQGSGEGNAAVPYPCLSYADQMWTLVSSGNGYYQLRNSNSGKCLTAPSWNGRNVIQYSCGNYLDQQWLVYTGSVQSRLENRDAGQCLTAPSWAAGDVILYTCDTWADQQWRQP